MTTETLENISGLADLQKLLEQLPAKVEGRIMRGALRAGQQVMLERAKQNIHDVTGELQNSLRITSSVRNGQVKANLVVGNKMAYYAHMVEFGTAAHWIRPKGAKSLFFAGLNRTAIDHPGAKPHPFMRPAFDAGHEEAIKKTADYISARLTREGLK